MESQYFLAFRMDGHFSLCRTVKIIIFQPTVKIIQDLSCLLQNFGEGNGTPLQYSCLENPMDRGAW